MDPKGGHSGSACVSADTPPCTPANWLNARKQRPSEVTHPRATRALPAILTLDFWGRDSGRVSVSLQLHMKDMSGTSLRPSGPVMNKVGRRGLGKSILENKTHMLHLLGE